MRTFLVIVLGVVIIVLARMSLYSVDASEYVYVTQLGQHVGTFDGGDPNNGAGLHAGWPWPIQTVTRLDRRLQFFDLPGMELLTHEGKAIDKTLTVEAFVCWRIADAAAVDRFIKQMGTPEQARLILGQRINSQLGAAIVQKKMDDLISTDPGTVPGKTRVDETMDALQAKLVSNLRTIVDRKYGIELVDIRLRRFNHPAQVRDAIFQRIRSERNKKVADYQSEGVRRAKNIESAAEEKVRDLLAKARYTEEKLKGEADTEAVRIRNQAHAKDPKFYVFLKKLEKLQNVLGDNKTVLLLSSHRFIFDLLFDPPQPDGTMVRPGKKGPSPPANGPAKKGPPPVKGPTKGGPS
jgi:membrane protease subunit HflC